VFAHAIRPIPDNEFSIFQSEFARSLNELTEWNESNFATTEEEQIQYFLVQVNWAVIYSRIRYIDILSGIKLHVIRIMEELERGSSFSILCS